MSAAQSNVTIWPRTLVRGHLFGIAAVCLLVIVSWLVGPAMQDRLLVMVEGTTSADAAAAGQTIDSLLWFLTIGGLIHCVLNSWIWLQLQHGRHPKALIVAAACNLLSMPIGTVLGIAVLVRFLQLQEQKQLPRA